MDLPALNKNRKERTKPVDTSLLYGKVPPQAVDLEKAVLGAILIEKKAFDVVSEFLRPAAFYVEAHQMIFSAAMGLAQKNAPIDVMTVIQELKFREQLDQVGGPYYITTLTNGVVSSANIVAHAKIVVEMFLLREVIRIGGEMVSKAFDDSTDAFKLIDEVEASVFALTSDNVKNDYVRIDSALVPVVQRIERLRVLDQSITGVPSQYEELDKVTHGWQPNDLIIIAARPSVGKTAFALNLARNAATDPSFPTAVGFFSLEMSTGQLTQRLLSAQSLLPLDNILIGRLDDNHMVTFYKKGVEPLSSLPIFIDDTAAITLFELRAKARRMVNKHKVRLIIIDYLQLMTSDERNNNNREREISKISAGLKQLAKELKVPIIALSQLSREVEKRTSKKPMLSDLRESGSIEQDADIVGFLYRPSLEDVQADASLANTGSLNIAKHRNGALVETFYSVRNPVQQWIGLKSPEPTAAVTSPAPAATQQRFIPLDQANKDQDAKLFIQKGAKINNSHFDDEAPF